MALARDHKAAMATSTHKVASDWLGHCNCHGEAEEYKDCRKDELHVDRFFDGGLDILESWVVMRLCERIF